LKKCRNENLASEVTLDAFCKGFLHIHKFKPNAQFSTWICAIAKNSLTDYNRKNNGSKLIFVDLFKDSHFHSSADYESDPIAELENTGSLTKQLDSLKAVHKQIIKLRYYDALKYDEIAQEIGIPLHTVKARLSRAKAALRKVHVAQTN
jgi:RNA polymerase sigma-70 factor (ECF subfamily)